MVKYGFNFKELEDRKKQLELLKSTQSLSDSQLDDIDRTIDMCDSILENFMKADQPSFDYQGDSIPSKKDLLDKMKEFVLYDDYNEENKFVRDALCSKLSKLIWKKDGNFSFEELNLSDSQAIELVGDMIKSKLGMNHYNIYKSLFVNKPDHVQFSDDISSGLYTSEGVDEVFAIIQNHDDIAKASDIAHEAGHFFASVISDNYIHPTSVLDEVESHFYEFLFIQYLIEENIYRDDAYKLFLESIYSSIERSYILNMEFSYPMYKINSIGDFKIMANKYNLYNLTGIFSSRELLNWINVYNDENPFMYIYSSLIAFELFEQYQINRNKKAVVSKYEKFISQIGKIPDYRLASVISRDYISFDGFKTLKKYKTKFLNIK